MIFTRLIKPLISNSFFIFGARGTGKTTWLSDHFASIPHVWINLLDPEEEEKFLLRPQEFSALLKSLPPKIKWVVIDEVQKVPKLLDLVHLHIEKKKLLFAQFQALRNGLAALGCCPRPCTIYSKTTTAVGKHLPPVNGIELFHKSCKYILI